MLKTQYYTKLSIIYSQKYLIYIKKLNAQLDNHQKMFRFDHPTRKFFIHMETSPLLMKGCKFCRVTPTLTRIINLLWSSLRTRDTHTYCRAFSSGAVTTYFYDLGLSRLGFQHPSFRLRGERFNPLRHHRG